MKFDFHYLWSAKYAKWIIISLITLFTVLIVMEVAWIFVSPLPKKIESIEVSAATSSISEDSHHNILKASLFGEYLPLNETHVKKSMLDVILVGILFAEPIEDSQVIIRSANGEEKVYTVGDSLPGGVTLKRIMAHGVLVERDGELESLGLIKEDLNFEPMPKPLKEE